MNTKKLLVFIIILSMALSTGLSYNVLVWDYDRGDSYEDPDTQQVIGSEVNLVSALQDNGESPEVLTSLPSDLSSYDIIYVCTGWYTC